jgi:ABC-type transport system substrate-binding protein
VQYLDPQVSYTAFDYYVFANYMESLIYFNGTSASNVIPWLAQNYTISPDGRTLNFTLRNNIHFADGEPLNSTAVYFSLNRLLIEDGSSPTSHGTQASWVLQQLLNTSLSTTVSGIPQPYTQQWVNEVLAENFVQITGPLTFTIHLVHPTAAFKYMIELNWAKIVDPYFVVQHDVALWNQSGTGYSLPYPTVSGNETNMIYQYFMDEVATCNAGATPKGCATTYLDGSFEGTTAGTGPYILQSFDQTTNEAILTANPNYWGGPYQFLGGSKIVPQIKTIDIKYVSSENTREIDLANAAKSGQAMTADITPAQLFDVADRNSWLNNNTLVSVTPGVTMYGPYPGLQTNFETFDTNVTNSQTGSFYKFQPFADLRIRLAFADAVNISAINISSNNKLGEVAPNVVPPGIPPVGSFNTSLTPTYSFNLTAVQDLLVAAMEKPITQFTFENGTSAPAGTFNNSFGCPTLSSSGTCSSPVPQTITLYYPTGDSVDQAIFEQIASAVNNVSATYNMGLTVDFTPVPSGQLFTQALSGYYYSYASLWGADYPWVLDFTAAMYAPGHIYTIPDGWNLTVMGNLYNQAVQANSVNNITGIINVTNQMNILANQQVMYLWTIYPEFFYAYTSNVHGVYYNPALLAPYDFSTMY